jgi:hypothetical protein
MYAIIRWDAEDEDEDEYKDEYEYSAGLGT